jgi:hypothetical protein
MTDDDFNEAYDVVPIEPGPHDPPRLPVNKITWPQVGRVTEPSRYMFTFGWLTVTAEDLAVWEQLPKQVSLYPLSVPPRAPSRSVRQFGLPHCSRRRCFYR